MTVHGDLEFVQVAEQVWAQNENRLSGVGRLIGNRTMGEQLHSEGSVVEHPGQQANRHVQA